MDDIRLITRQELERKLEVMRATFAEKRTALKQANVVGTEGVTGDLIGKLSTIYNRVGLKIKGRDLGNSVKITVKTPVYSDSREFGYNQFTVDNIADMLSTTYVQDEFLSGAENNVKILNLVMDNFNTPERTIYYTVSDLKIPVTELTNRRVVFGIKPDVAYDVIPTLLTVQEALDLLPDILKIDLDREERELRKMYEVDTIEDVVYSKNKVHRALGIRILHRFDTIIQYLYYRKSEKRDGYEVQDGIMSVYKDNTVILQFALPQSAVK